MKELIATVIARGGTPLRYCRRPTVFGNEAEFRWRPYRNSSRDCVKMEFDVNDEEHAECGRLIFIFFTSET